MSLALLLFALPAPASAGPCERGELPAPTPVGLAASASADFASTPGACAETRADAAGRASLLVDEPEFYGMLVGDVDLSGGFAPSPDFWLTASLAAVEHRYVQSATIVATATDLGPATLAAHFAAARSERLQLSPYLRALLPTGTATRYAILYGAEPGVSAVWAPRSRLALTLGGSTPVTWTTLGSRTRTTLEARISADASYAPWTFLEPAIGLEVRMSGDRAGPLETIAPAAAVRFYPWRDLQANVALVLPLVGADRTDLRARLGVGWVF